jgi:hypothetical protein
MLQPGFLKHRSQVLVVGEESPASEGRSWIRRSRPTLPLPTLLPCQNISLGVLNHAVYAPSPVTKLFFIVTPGMSYSSNFTPRAFSLATSASMLATRQRPGWPSFLLLPICRRAGGKIDTLNIFFSGVFDKCGNPQSNLLGGGNHPAFLLAKVDFGSKCEGMDFGIDGNPLE